MPASACAASSGWMPPPSRSARRSGDPRPARSRPADHADRVPRGTAGDSGPWADRGGRSGGGRMIGKISAPRGTRVEPLIWYLYGPGRHEEHTDPHIVAGWRHPAELEPPLRPAGGRDFRLLTGLLRHPPES